MFDRQVTKVKRFTYGEKADNQQQANLTRRGGIDGILHRALVIGYRVFPRKTSAYCGTQAQAPILPGANRKDPSPRLADAFENIEKSASLCIGVSCCCRPIRLFEKPPVGYDG